jgi:hypothetical protein
MKELKRGHAWTRVLASLLIDATALFNLARLLSHHAMMKFTYLSICKTLWVCRKIVQIALIEFNFGIKYGLSGGAS